MTKVCIQVQRRSDDASVARLLNVLMRLAMAKEVCIQKGARRKAYTNIVVQTSSLRKLWDALSPTVRNRILAQCTIVICEGTHGWDDHELIYHMDPEQIDRKWR